MTALRLARLARVAVCALGLAGCGSSPESTFFALAPTKGASQPIALHAVRVRRPGLAGYLDRPEIVRRVVAYRLGMTGTDRWAEPLDAMIGRVLAQDVAARCAGTSVFGEAGAITVDPDATIEVDIERFDVGANGDVELIAELAVERGSSHAASTARTVTLSAHPADGSTPALVGAMSDLLGQLADQAAAALRGV